MTDRPNDVLTVTLSEFDDHGTTRARVANRWIEVEHGIPGETVAIELMGQKRQRGRIVDLIKSAGDRTFPPCEYYREWKCGGCQWQHLSYRSQLRRKRRAVEAEMARVGLDFHVTGTHSLGEPWRYRTTAGISLGKHAGFRRQGSLAIVPIEDCPISHPLIGELMATLNAALRAETLPNYRGRVRLDARVVDGPALQTVVRPSDDYVADDSDLATLTSLLAGLSFVESVSLLSTEGELHVESGDPFGLMTIAGRPVTVHAASFFQTNVSLLAELIARLRTEAMRRERPRVADIYGGVGIFGLFLADCAEDVLVVESDIFAEAACRRTAEAWGLKNVQFRTEDAEVGLAEAQGYDVIVVDPPRTGLSENVIESLVELAPDTILYVSCLAQSLARDLQVLVAEGYRVDGLEVFDFYPQTYHIEILAVLHRSEEAEEERPLAEARGGSTASTHR